ncbi:MAG: neutral/alkaline non-lysosomal ceramidase N-terminal domain-containing protein [Bryobacteraceae bacterium]
MRALLVGLAVAWAALAAEEFRAGVARVDITPATPVWMSGYAQRNKPSEGVDTPLMAKALALQDKKGMRVVIVTTDLLGLPRAITDPVAARAEKEYGLRRAQILFNSSHTHAGPVLRTNTQAMYELPDAEWKRLADYHVKLGDDLFAVIGAALGKMEPASLHFGQGTAGFAVNRREFTRKGVIIGVNRDGATDHSVPVIDVRNAKGEHLAILFGYACHNTTLGGNHYRLNADYAGHAQMLLEKQFASATALFLLLCAGDQNPDPRGTVDHVAKHGSALAASVAKVLEAGGDLMRSPIRAAYQVTDLAFAVHTREQYEEEAKSPDVYKQRRAKAMLAAYATGKPPRSTPYPVQAIRFAPGITLLALGGEVVVDYALRVKREFTHDRMIVAGYSNDVMCYIPTLKVLREGGYEADFSMVYYGTPGKFSEDVEAAVFQSIGSVLRRTGAK